MKFWDSSAIVPLLIGEATTKRMQSLLNRDAEMLVWWASGVECASAIAWLERDDALRQHRRRSCVRSAPAVTGALARG